jgi:DNA-binding NarL/FixJ family response regulator
VLARDQPIDVAVVDLQLAAPSGLDTAKALWAASPNVRVVFVSLVSGKGRR